MFSCEFGHFLLLSHEEKRLNSSIASWPPCSDAERWFDVWNFAEPSLFDAETAPFGALFQQSWMIETRWFITVNRWSYCDVLWVWQCRRCNGAAAVSVSALSSRIFQQRRQPAITGTEEHYESWKWNIRANVSVLTVIWGLLSLHNWRGNRLWF